MLTGQKSAWVSNGTIASHALLFLSIDREDGTSGGGVAFVPLDLDGVTRGKPLNKMGQRALNQGEIYFDDVKLPKELMLIEPEMYEFTLDMVLADGQRRDGRDLHRRGAVGLRGGAGLHEGARAGRQAHLRAPARAEAPVRHVPDRRGLPRALAATRSSTTR